MMENTDKQACKEHDKCMEMLQLILDGEASDSDKDYYFNHMENCMPCYREYNLESAIRQVLKSKCHNKAVPTDLVDSIKSKIRTTV